MAKGFPDFFGQSIFPVYGSVVNDNVAAAHSASGATDTIHTVTGKGILRGLDCFMLNAGQDGDLTMILYLTIDATTNIQLCSTNAGARTGGILETCFGKVSKLEYEDSFTDVFLKKEIPFITSLLVKWYAAYTAGAPAYNLSTYYSLYT